MSNIKKKRKETSVNQTSNNISESVEAMVNKKSGRVKKQVSTEQVDIELQATNVVNEDENKAAKKEPKEGVLVKLPQVMNQVVNTKNAIQTFSKAQEKAKTYALVVKKQSTDLVQHINEQYVEGTKLEGVVEKIDNTIKLMLPRSDMQYENPSVQAAAGAIRFGMWLFTAIFVFGFGWALLAPLDSAAVAPGIVVLNANRKVVDHLEGGLVKEILVHDGDTVTQGQALIKLDEISAKARRDIALGQFLATKALEDRLTAERDDLEDVVFSEEVEKYKERLDVQKIMEAQRRIFKTRKESIISQRNIIEQRIKQLNDEYDGMYAQEQASAAQIKLIEEEAATVRTLLEKGQALKPRLLALERTQADLLGKQGQFKALGAKAKQAQGENELNILNLQTDRLKEVVTQLRDAQVQVADTRERVTAAEDVMKRIVITAPQGGKITGLKFHTLGGVIPPNAPILEIVPQDDTLVIDAQVAPEDIDVVHKGLKAKIRLSAFSSRHVPMIEGTVDYVSADRISDPKTGLSYYTARIRINEKELEQIAFKTELYPGMSADVLIVTGERTLIQYLISPISSAFDKAFKEQ